MNEPRSAERLPLNFLPDVMMVREPFPETEASQPLDAALADIARRVPNPTPPATFTTDMQRFAAGADNIMAQLESTTDELRLALAENAILRGRNTDLEKNVERLNEYWEKQYEQVNAARQRISRLYYALVSRLDGIVEFTVGTREAAKREAFAPDEERPPRPEGVEVIERDVTEQELRDALGRLAATSH